MILLLLLKTGYVRPERFFWVGFKKKNNVYRFAVAWWECECDCKYKTVNQQVRPLLEYRVTLQVVISFSMLDLLTRVDPYHSPYTSLQIDQISFCKVSQPEVNEAGLSFTGRMLDRHVVLNERTNE